MCPKVFSRAASQRARGNRCKGATFPSCRNVAVGELASSVGIPGILSSPFTAKCQQPLKAQEQQQQSPHSAPNSLTGVVHFPFPRHPHYGARAANGSES